MEYILGIDTSCDETSAAVLADGKYLLSNIIGYQWEIHKKFGGVVPELACRRHIEVIYPITEEAINRAGIGLKDLSAIAVTTSPGLIGALLVGVSFAKGLAYGLKIPLISVNHLEGHIWSIFLEKRVLRPFIVLVVSGGHTNLYLVKNIGDYKLLGRTVDDAAGEAFDKIAKILGIGYPGGPAIEQWAQKGNPEAIVFPRAMLGRKDFNFSFSGMKTAVINYIRSLYPVAHVDEIPEALKDDETLKADIASAFQQAVVDILVEKTLRAATELNIKRIVIAGGVASNRLLRETMTQKGQTLGIKVYTPSPVFCTDNGAMIAWVGYRYYKKKKFAHLDLNPEARSSLGME